MLRASGSQTGVMPGDRHAVIEVEAVSQVFAGGAGRLVALRDINVSISPNEFVSFVGPSGCGKSTLLNIIAGLQRPSTGRVLLNGSEVRSPSRNVGFMFQAPVLLPWRTVQKNVLLPAEILGTDTKMATERARAAIELVGLSEFARSYPRELSGGMQQRMALARVLAYEPEVILMDEPFGALDEFTREAMNLELLRIADTTEMTVVFVTHNIVEAVFLSDRVVVLSPRPGEVAGIVDVPLDRPREIRMMGERAFSELVFAVRRTLGARR